MQRLIGRRMVLDVARQGAVEGVIHFELDEHREKTPFGKSARQLAQFQTNRHRVAVAAIYDPGDTPHPPRRPGGPFSGQRAPLGAQAGDLWHGRLLLFGTLVGLAQADSRLSGPASLWPSGTPLSVFRPR